MITTADKFMMKCLKDAGFEIPDIAKAYSLTKERVRLILKNVYKPTTYDWRDATCGECGYWCGWCRKFENNHHADYKDFSACPDYEPRELNNETTT